MLPTLDYAFFAARLHGFFAVGGHEGVTLTLTAADRLPPQAPGHVGFSLMFRGPLQPQLEQMTYLLGTADAGTFPLFIVPVGRDQAGMQYQAIFN
ncbi:hypothetical protein RBA41_26625 [Massilia sp. CCM 9210]|uniref:DUF6916 family protein n=1 Tax=Massilia scottii TaxID=3057166 RepID=UPI0027965CC0|nr:hypothetical protein [Massilia sp. CCM 9210]MDQ1816884.1 hypothetical protein [Massilia sp. CCM 9210]